MNILKSWSSMLFNAETSTCTFLPFKLLVMTEELTALYEKKDEGSD